MTDNLREPRLQRRRRSIRLWGYDYAQPGEYFLTICSHDRECLFGNIVDGEMRHNQLGEIVATCWMEIPAHFPGVELDAFVVMPNHLHGIIVVGATHASPLRALPNTLVSPIRPRGPQPGSVGAIVGSFKSATTRRINRLRNTPGTIVWQRNYWEHIVRDESSLAYIHDYILSNPACWEADRENPRRTKPDDFARWLTTLPVRKR